MRWTTPKYSGSDNTPIRATPSVCIVYTSGASDDFNADLEDEPEDLPLNGWESPEDAADAADVEEAKRRLADPNETTMSLDDLRDELGV